MDPLLVVSSPQRAIVQAGATLSSRKLDWLILLNNGFFIHDGFFTPLEDGLFEVNMALVSFLMASSPTVYTVSLTALRADSHVTLASADVLQRQPRQILQAVWRVQLLAGDQASLEIHVEGDTTAFNSLVLCVRDMT